jgi:23S rRNA (guanosine2251-2'-O)-methyltransferase
LLRLADVQKHLHPEMALKHLVNFIVPFERLLQKSVQDDDFLVEENDKAVKDSETIPLVMVLHNIRSAFNVGSALRTAECLAIEKVYLCGYTPTPAQDKVARTALGTESLMEWEEQPAVLELLAKLKADGYHLIALETAEKSVDLYKEFPRRPTALVVGNERFGLDQDILKAVDEIRRIPLRGQKNSLNVSVSLAVAGFEWTRQWKPN